MALQNVWEHNFPEPCGKGGCCGTNWPTEVVEMTTVCGFDENDRFFTTFCEPYMGHTFRLFYTFHPKKDTKNVFEEKCLK
jgi:hypothetical protein